MTVGVDVTLGVAVVRGVRVARGVEVERGVDVERGVRVAGSDRGVLVAVGEVGGLLTWTMTVIGTESRPRPSLTQRVRATLCPTRASGDAVTVTVVV